jgi:hypothetical protein
MILKLTTLNLIYKVSCQTTITYLQKIKFTLCLLTTTLFATSTGTLLLARFNADGDDDIAFVTSLKKFS